MLPQNGTLKKSKKNNSKSKPDLAQGLRYLFVNELQEIYCVEKALTKAIPKIIKKATADDLVEALTRHLDVTKVHVTILDEIFSSIGEKKDPQKCKAMSDLIKKTKEVIKETEAGRVRDAGIIASMQKVEHYEIAAYGTLCNFAEVLRETHAYPLLNEILMQEKVANEKLSEIAATNINAKVTNTEEAVDFTIEIPAPIL